MSDVLRHPSTDAFAARANADTIVSIQAAHSAELASVYSQLRAKQADLLRANRAAFEVRDSLINAVVQLPDGTWHTLYSLFEDSHTEAYKLTLALCTLCGAPKCDGTNGPEGCR